MPGQSPTNLQRFGSDRVLLAALLISLLVHAMALLSPHNPPSAESSAALRATLLSPPATQAAPAIEPVAADKPIVPPKRETLPEPIERTYAKAAPLAQGLESPADAQAPATGGSGPSDAAAPPSATTAAPSPSPRPVIDLNGLRQYHAALSRVADRFRRYPPQAREAGWEGQIAMRLSISEAGTVAGLELIGSSGYAILDRAALEMMNLAANHTAVPESLRGRAFSIDLAAKYNFRDEP